MMLSAQLSNQNSTYKDHIHELERELMLLIINPTLHVAAFCVSTFDYDNDGVDG
jgi:hypothetical protein